MVYVSVAGTGVWTTYPTGGTATTYPVTGLDGPTTYTIAVRAVNVNGPGSWSNTTSVTPLASASAPTAPTSLTGTAGVGQVSLAWTAPSSDGGSAITSYDVDVSAVGTGTWSTINTGSTATSRTVTGLDSTKSYDVRVRAVNSVGSGSWSNTFNVTPLAAPTAPTAPRDLVAEPSTSGTIRLSWSAPASDGGAAIDYYTVTATDGVGPPRQITSTGTSTDFGGLTDGVIYTFTVSAHNSVGDGPASTGVTATPDAGPPASSGGASSAPAPATTSTGPTELPAPKAAASPVETVDVPVAHAVVAVDDEFRYTQNDGSRQLYPLPGVLTNDSDTAGHALSIRAGRVTGTNGGRLTLRSNGSFTYAPDPTAPSRGRERFTITVVDSAGETARSRVTILRNQAPVVPRVEYATRQGVTLRVGAGDGLLARASDPEGDRMSVTTVGPYPADWHKGGLNLQRDGSPDLLPLPG